MKIIKNSINFNVKPSTTFSKEDLWFGGTEMFWNEFMSTRETDTAVLQKYISREKSYIDIGAWIGSTVLFGAQLAKKCFAFEADPVAFSFFKNNLNENPNIINISAHQIAISDKTGFVEFGTKTNRGDSMSSILWNQNKNTWKAESLSLEDCINKYNINDCNFIKMDIEGGEFTVLPASKNILKEIQPTLYLSLHAPWFENKQDFFDKIIDTLSIYKYIYDHSGNKLSLNDIRQMSGFSAIVATNL